MIPIIEIAQHQIQRRPLWFFNNNNPEWQKVWKALKAATGYGYDNNKTIWSNIYGHHYSINIHKSSKEWEISVWDDVGSTSIGVLKQKIENAETDILSNENYSKLSKLTEDFGKDKVPCSGCSNTTNVKGNGRRYFAGIYCEHCWETKYKAIEAKENYN